MNKHIAARPAPAEPEFAMAPLLSAGPVVADAEGPTGVAVADVRVLPVGTVPFPWPVSEGCTKVDVTFPDGWTKVDVRVERVLGA